MATISAFRVTQHSQIFSFFFRNRIQCNALYQLYNCQALSTYAVATIIDRNKENVTFRTSCGQLTSELLESIKAVLGMLRRSIGP